MRATILLHEIYGLGMKNHRGEAEKWVSTMHRFGAKYGSAFTLSVKGISELDIILRQLEREFLDELRSPEGPPFTLTFNFISTLSDAWLLIAYEAVRAAKAKKIGDDKLNVLHDQLALARMPIAKAEMAGADRYKRSKGQLPDIMLHTVDDDIDHPGRPYAEAHGSYIIPKSVCQGTGAVIWFPVDLKTEQTVPVCRRDLADAFLKIFD